MILLMVKAYNNEEYELPTLGEMARKCIVARAASRAGSRARAASGGSRGRE